MHELETANAVSKHRAPHTTTPIFFFFFLASTPPPSFLALIRALLARSIVYDFFSFYLLFSSSVSFICTAQEGRRADEFLYAKHVIICKYILCHVAKLPPLYVWVSLIG